MRRGEPLGRSGPISPADAHEPGRRADGLHQRPHNVSCWTKMPWEPFLGRQSAPPPHSVLCPFPLTAPYGGQPLDCHRGSLLLLPEKAPTTHSPGGLKAKLKSHIECCWDFARCFLLSFHWNIHCQRLQAAEPFAVVPLTLPSYSWQWQNRASQGTCLACSLGCKEWKPTEPPSY